MWFDVFLINGYIVNFLGYCYDSNYDIFNVKCYIGKKNFLDFYCGVGMD